MGCKGGGKRRIVSQVSYGQRRASVAGVLVLKKKISRSLEDSLDFFFF